MRWSPLTTQRTLNEPVSSPALGTISTIIVPLPATRLSIRTQKAGIVGVANTSGGAENEAAKQGFIRGWRGSLPRLLWADPPEGAGHTLAPIREDEAEPP